MADLMQIRRRILIDAPQIMTETGTDVTFFADRSADIQSCVLDLAAIQDGSGTPSKTNVRPITPWKAFNLYHSDGTGQQTYSYSFFGARAGGWLNIITGELYTTEYKITYDGDESWNSVGSKFYVNLRDSGFRDSSGTNAICNMYPFAGLCGSSSSVTQDKHYYLQRSSNLDYCRVWIYDTDFSSVADFKEFLDSNPLEVTFPVDRYTTTVTANHIRAHTGQNRVWNSQGGEMTIKYWTH